MTEAQFTNEANETRPGLDVEAVIVGAGFSGLYMLKRLRDSGISAKVFEAGSDVGGTWFWNRYPGARCDLESFDYSYSFSPELEQEWEWTERYPAQPEIHSYLRYVAAKFDLRGDTQTETRVTSAAFNEKLNRWVVTTDNGQETTARYCIMATGNLSSAKVPEFPGLESFRGNWYHTGNWPDGGVGFTGQRVGVVGTGSSGIQAIPLIAQEAERLTVFQRTPNFVVPAKNSPLDEETKADVKANYRERRELARRSRFGVPATFPETSALEVDDDERLRTYESAWQNSSLLAFRLTYSDLLTDRRANETVAEFLKSKVRGIIDDKTTADALTSMDYPYGTKRPCLSPTYYETFNRDNVGMVDVRASPIAEVTEEGIQTTYRHYDFDSIVFATGFDAMTGALLKIDIRGRSGMQLKEKWAHGPRAYLGVATAGFPNMFIITGPGSPSVISNMVVSIEQHVEWIADCIDYMQSRGQTDIEADCQAEESWAEHVNDVANATLYPQANSWYMGANIPGKPRVFMPYIGGVGVYRGKCEAEAAAGYPGFRMA